MGEAIEVKEDKANWLRQTLDVSKGVKSTEFLLTVIVLLYSCIPFITDISKIAAALVVSVYTISRGHVKKVTVNNYSIRK